MSTNPGKFIVVEGCEGAGKSTAIEYLQSHLPDDRFLFTREPGGSKLAEQLRTIIKDRTLGGNADAVTLLLMFFAARADFMRSVVRPALEQGVHVISDRFDASTYAYQIIAGGQSGSEERLFQGLRSVICKPIPDLYIYMDVTPEKGLARAHAGGTSDHFHEKGSRYHSDVRLGFKGFLSGYAPRNSVVVDANRDEPELVAQDVLAIVRKTAPV